MKKTLPLFLILLVPLAAAALNAPDGQTSVAVQVPEALNTILSGLILLGVTVGLQQVFEWTGLDLRGLGAALAVSLSGFVVAELQGYINTIPAQYDQLATIAIQVLVVILSGLGYLRLLVSRERAATFLQ